VSGKESGNLSHGLQIFWGPMRILLFGDVNIAVNNEYSTVLEDGYTSLLHEVRDSLNWVADYIEQKAGQIDLVINTGDLIDTHGFVEGLTLNVAWEGIQKISQSCVRSGIELISLVGNHEWVIEGKIDTIPFLPGKTIRSPSKHSGILFLPYTKDLKVAKKYIREYLEETGSSLIVSHLDVIGGSWGGRLSNIGVSLPDVEGAVMLNGHFHNPQILKGNNSIIVNIGALTYQNFKDQYDPYGPPRGIFLFDTDTGEHEWVANPHTSLFYTITPEDECDLFEKVAEVYSQPRMNIKIVPQFEVDDADLTGQLGVFQNYKIIQSRAHEEIRLSFNERAVPQDIWEVYLNSISIPADVDKDQCLALGNEALSEAESVDDRPLYEDIEITHIHAENFMSIDIVDFDIPKKPVVVTVLGINKDKLTLNNNGAGKSAFFEVIPFCWWGVTLRGLSLDECIHTDRLDIGCHCYVEFRKGKNHLKVTRSRKHIDYGDDVQLFVNGENVSERTKPATQKKIEAEIGMSLDEFRQLICLSGNSNHFMNIKNDTDRKDILDGIIGTKIYSLASGQISKKVARLETQKASIEVEADALEETVKINTQEINDLLHLRNESRKQIELKTQHLNNRIDEESASRQYALGEWKRLNDENEAVGIRLDAKRLELEKSKHDIDSRREDIAKKSERISMLLQTKKNKLDLLEQGICDKCGSKVPISKTQSDVLELDEESGSLRDQVSLAREEVAQINQVKAGLEIEFNELMNERMNFTSELARCKYGIQTSNQTIRQLKEDIQNLRNEEDVFSPKIEECRTNKKEAEDQLKPLEGKYQTVLAEWRSAKFVDEHFKPTKLRSYVFDYAISMANKYLTSLSSTFSQNDIQVQMRSTRDQKKSTVAKIDFITSTKSPRYVGDSSGEKQRSSLMVQFGLSELSRLYRNSTNMIVVDEQDSGLDSLGIKYFMELLASLGRTVFLVSHTISLQNATENSIIAIKEKDVTRYEINLVEYDEI